jgi:hypothetical protein
MNRAAIACGGVLAAVATAVAVTVGGATPAHAATPVPRFSVAPGLGIGSFAGFGGQLNQHVYANISGPPPDLPTLEAKIVALRPQFVRIFFNTTEWTYPDRMASFVRTVQLAQRAQAHVDITWQGSTAAFAAANMQRFADVLADLLTNRGIDWLWVTLFNEPNSTKITLAQYENVYRLLDAALRDRGVRDRVHFMGGDLVGTTSPLGQSQVDWFQYLAGDMGDLLDAWSVHVYWNFWEPDKINRRLETEVRAIFAAIPPPQRRPLYVTEFGVRGLPTIEGEQNPHPGLWLDGRPLEETIAASFQEAWFMIRAAQLGFTGVAKWDLDSGKYDNGTQDFCAVGPGAAGWPTRPVYDLLRLLDAATEPRGGDMFEVVRAADAEPTGLLTAYVSPAGTTTVLGLDTRGGILATMSHEETSYSVGGLLPNTLFHLVSWNGDGRGTNTDIGFLDSGPDGIVEFSVPLDAVFVLTNTPLAGDPAGSS